MSYDDDGPRPAELLELFEQARQRFASLYLIEATGRKVVFEINSIRCSFVRDEQGVLSRVVNGQVYDDEEWRLLSDLSRTLMDAVFSGYKNVKKGRKARQLQPAHP